jgi:hypothetical protein
VPLWCPRSGLILAAGPGVNNATANILIIRFSVKKYVDAIPIGSLSTPITTKTKGQGDTSAYDIGIIGSYYSPHIPLSLSDVFCWQEGQLDMSWLPRLSENPMSIFSSLKQEEGTRFLTANSYWD